MKKFKLQILGTSSSGNCGIIQTEKSKILIDVGFTGKCICNGLADLGISITNIDAVFITHEHEDHVKGVRGLAKYDNLKYFANKLTASEIEKKYNKKLNWQLFNSGEQFELSDLKITSFSIPHDSTDAVGYVFECGNEKIAWATDLGKITHVVKNKLQDVDALILESNYDPRMLNASSRPESLKARIKGTHGHLSNESCGEFLREYENSKLEHLFLAHISRECNSTYLVSQMLASSYNGNANTAIVNPSEFLPANASIGF